MWKMVLTQRGSRAAHAASTDAREQPRCMQLHTELKRGAMAAGTPRLTQVCDLLPTTAVMTLSCVMVVHGNESGMVHRGAQLHSRARLTAASAHPSAAALSCPHARGNRWRPHALRICGHPPKAALRYAL